MVDELELKVINDPELIVLSNLEPLYREFVETGMTPGDDNNANDIPDYYDLLDRINQYSSDHHGILFDLNQEIAGYQAKSYDSDAKKMCLDIKKLVHDISNIHPFKYVVIVGDDEVVPMFRRYDGTNQEAGYPVSLGGDFGNRTLKDSALGYIMSDVPYGMYEAQNPIFNDRPLLDAAVGRIFAKLPSTMINQIIANETALDVSDVSSAAIFSIRDEPHNFRWPLSIELGLKPVLQNFAPGEVDPTKAVQEYTPGNCYWWDADLYPWGPKRYADAVSRVSLTMIWGHADHTEYENTGNNWDPSAPLEYTHYDSMNAAPRSLIVTIGCHSGYHSSHQSDVGHFGPYGAGLVKSALEKEVSYLAPTTYGLRTGNSAQLHELIFKGFFNNLFDANTQTIGEAIKKAYRDYWMNTNPRWAGDPHSAYSAYGTVYYGLPTRPLQHSANLRHAAQALELSEREEENDGQIFRASLQASASETMSITVDVPELKVTQDEKGAILFEVPNDGTFVSQPFAPALPLVTRSFLLPKGTTVNDVILAEQNSALYPEKVSLQVPPVINATLGELKGSFEVPNPYPERIFWWNTFATDGGVMLNISIVPMQYNPETGEATLYSHLKFSASLSTPLSATTFGSVTVNRGNPLEINQAGLPIDLTINSPVDQDAILSFTIRDRSGNILGSGRKSVSLISGVTPCLFEFNTTNWSPGPKDFVIALTGDTVLATWNQTLDTAGINLESDLAQRIYLPAESVALLDVEVRNEQGIGVNDLEQGNFDLLLNGGPLAINSLENKGSGRYQLPISLTELGEGFFRLDLTARDQRGMQNSDRNYFAIQADTETPVVKNTVPKKNATGVSLEQVISLTFSEDIGKSTAFDDISIKTGGEAVSYTAQISGSTLTLNPVSNLKPGSIYTVTIPKNAVKDLTGNDIAWDYRFQFVTYAGPDTLLPVVASTDPVNGTINFPATARISISFSESIATGPVFADITLQADDNPVVFTTTINGARLILTPDLPLPYGSNCQVTIPAGALQDQVGNLLSAPFSLTFTVETGPDSAPPQIVETIPVQDGQGVVPDALVNIVFNEPIKAGSDFGNITWMAGDAVVGFATDIQGQTLTLTASNPLPLSTACTVTVPAAAIMDISENQLVSGDTFTFTTGDIPDTSSPQITRTIPADEGQGVLLGAPVLAYFDEAIQESAHFAEILWQTADKDVTFNPVIDGRILTLTPQENLDYSLSYTITIPADAVKDLADNTLENSYSFTFTTGDSPDTIPPAIARTSPARDEEGVSTDALFYVVFDEAVQASATFNTIKVESGGTTIDYNAVINGKTLTITPSNILSLNTVYQVTIPAGAVKDLNGNDLAGEMLYSFTTIAELEGDTTPPAMCGSQPINNASDVPVNQTITLTFSESIIQGTSFDTIALQAGEVEVPLNVTISRNTLTITPVTDLVYSTTYVLTIPAGAVKDLIGNALADTISLTFTTVKEVEEPPVDPAPTVVQTTPINNATNVAITQTIQIAFSEAVAAGSTFSAISLKTGNVDVPFTSTVSGNNLTIKPNANLAYSSTYVLTIPAGAVEDLTGNALVDTINLSFTTEASPGGGGGGVPSSGGSTPSTDGDQPAGNVITGEDVQQAQGNAYSRDITASQTTHTVLVENSALSQMLQTGRSIIIASSGAQIILNPQQGQQLLSQDQDINLNISFSHPETLPPPRGTLTPGATGVEINFAHGQDSTGELAAGSSTLILSYQPDLVQNPLKLGIYKLVNGKWEYIGGRVNPETGTIQTTISSSGQYMIFENNRTFLDISNHWAQSDIEVLASRFIVNGRPGSIFGPQDHITRAELAAILVNTLNFTGIEYQVGQTGTFRDVRADDWFAEVVRQASAAQLIKGYPNGTFRPHNPATREEIATVINTLAELLKLETISSNPNPLDQFVDSDQISDWARESMAQAIRLGILQGTPQRQLHPSTYITRAELCTMIMRML